MKVSLLVFGFFNSAVVNGSSFHSELTVDTWKNVVADSRHLFIVEYYSDKCRSCKEFSPVWSTLASTTEKEYHVARVNIDTKSGLILAKKNSILQKGIPAIQVVAGSHSEVIMAGSLQKINTLLEKIKETTKRYKATKNNEGLYTYGLFFTEIENAEL